MDERGGDIIIIIWMKAKCNICKFNYVGSLS